MEQSWSDCSTPIFRSAPTTGKSPGRLTGNPGQGEEAEGNAGARGADVEGLKGFVNGLGTVVNTGKLGLEFSLKGGQLRFDCFHALVGVSNVLGAFEGPADVAGRAGCTADRGCGHGFPAKKSAENGGAQGEGGVDSGLIGLGFSGFDPLSGALKAGF